MIRIGVVGHRYLGIGETVTFVAQQCSEILKHAQTIQSDVVALSAIATGADTLFAEAALGLGIPLEVVQPFEDYISDFRPALAQTRYERLRAAAHSETRLAFVCRSDEAYRAAMNWIVERSDVLVAVWDGLPGAGLGSTSNAVKQAFQMNRPWIHLNVVDRSVTSHCARVATNQYGKREPPRLMGGNFEGGPK